MNMRSLFPIAKSLAIGLPLILSAVATFAQTNILIVPNSLATVEGDSGNSYPFNIGTNSTMRYQQVYAASQFGALPPGGTNLIGIAFRLDAGWPPFSSTLPAVQINLSITTKAPDGLSTTFANNVGADDTVVFSGPLSLSSSGSGSPAPFDIVILFSTQFFYNPDRGNLLLDVRNFGGGSISQPDATSVTGDSVSRVYGPVATSTGGADTAGLVTEFIYRTAGQAPAVTNPPQSQLVACGSTASFSVGATGTQPLSYQWRRNGVNLAGNTIGGLVLQTVDVTFEGIYDVVVSNSFGSVTSAPAALSIIDPTPYSLRVSQQGSNVLITWPATCASYVLQEAASLEPPADWNAVAKPPTLIGGTNFVTVPLTASRFYRLISSSARDNVVAGRWTANGPGLCGRLSGIVAKPGDPNTLLVSSPGGGVWRTFNGGLSWAMPLNYALADYSVLHLEWDRVRSGRLYAPTYSDLYATTDLGDHWTNLTHFGGYPAPLMPLDHTSDPRPFAQLRYSPFAADGTVFWSKPCLGLYYSYNGSTFVHTWPFSGGATNPDNCILSIAADDSTGYVYFSTMNRDPFGSAHLFRSSCPWTAITPCLSWVPANTGLPNNSLVAAIAYGGSANVLAAAIDVGSSSQIYTTTTGINWSPAPNQPPSPAWDPRILVSPTANQLLLSTVLAYETHNWGNTWNMFSYAGMHPDVRAYYWGSFQSSNYLWLTTDGTAASGTYAAISRFNFTPGSTPSGGVTVGVNGMNTWQDYFFVATGNSGVSGVRRRYFMGSQDNGCLASDDGTIWTTAGTPPGACGDYPSLVFAPSNPDRAYARTCDGASFARTDNAYSAGSAAAVVWSSITPATPNYTPQIWTENMIAVDPLNQNHVCFANSFDIAVSGDGGNTWAHHSLPGNAWPVCVFFNSTGDLYAGTIDHGAYKSIDNGLSWSPFGLNSPAPKIVFGIAHSSAGGGVGTFFLATTRGLHRQLPGGPWTFQTFDPSYTVSDVRVDPANSNRVAICMGFVSLGGQHRGGVLLSTDNGTTFTSLTAGLDIHQAPIAAIQFDPVDSRFIHAAVYGLGGWTGFAP
jgi:Immunoglobulin I-set domain